MRPHAKRDLIVTLAALAMLLAWEAVGWDMRIAAHYADARGFLLRDAWFTRDVLHEGGRALGWAALITTFALALHGLGSALSRRTRMAWFGVVMFCLIAVPALKGISRSSCPWDMLAFGGTVDYVPHWLLGVSDGGPGHCFPSGHAVAAFCFLPLFFQWRRQRPALARALLALILGLGTLFGWGQLARGAHFPSHTMWSAWLCWTIGAAAAVWLDRDPAQAPAA
jgi:membrane-associated PAP2 superfamily phosphatase